MPIVSESSVRCDFRFCSRNAIERPPEAGQELCHPRRPTRSIMQIASGLRLIAPTPCPANRSAGLTLVRSDPIAGLNTRGMRAYSAPSYRTGLHERGGEGGRLRTGFKRCLQKRAEPFDRHGRTDAERSLINLSTSDSRSRVNRGTRIENWKPERDLNSALRGRTNGKEILLISKSNHLSSKLAIALASTRSERL